MNYLEVLSSVELFEGMSKTELEVISGICRERTFAKDEVITEQGTPGEELFVVCQGFVEVLRSGSGSEPAPRSVVHLGKGQIFGEMALVDRGPRSASVRSAKDETTVLVIHRDDFENACESNHHLGFIVMRNIAADLSFKLRHRHLTGR